jgi:hypothetical protein
LVKVLTVHQIGCLLNPFFYEILVRIINILKVSKIDCLRFVMCPLQALVLISFFFVAAINSTNEANKAGSMCC